MPELDQMLLRSISAAPSFERLAAELDTAKAGRRFSVKGLRASALGAVAACLTTPRERPLATVILLVTANAERSAEIYDDLVFFGVDRVFHFPKTQVLPYEPEEPLLEEQVKHLEFLHYLSECGDTPVSATPAVCVTSVEALFTRVAPLHTIRGLTMSVKWGEPVDSEQFSRRAVDLGFERVPTVEARGEFAVRGGIIDIFPLDTENPLRIDLFGNDIESMRWFDLHTQRSLKNTPDVESITILPARERVLLEAAGIRNLPGSPAAPEPESATGNSEFRIQNSELKPLPSLLPPGSLLILDSPETFPLLDERFRQIVQRQFAEYAADAPGLHRPDALYATLKEVEGASAAFTQVHHTLVIDTLHGAGISFHTTSFETTKPSLEHYVTQIRKRLADDFTVSIVCDNEGQAQRMDEMLRENEIGSVIVPGADAKPGKGDDAGARDVVRRLRAAAPFEGFRDIIITTGPMHSGFVFPEAQLYIITDREIFGRYRRRHVYRKIYKGAPIADAREIRKGDFVVHLDHGIGRFEGIRTQNVDGKITDFLELIYADNDKLLVPVEKIAYVHKFSGPEQAEPQLDKLGTKKWLQRRRKSQEAIENLAKDLLGLYARRASARGYTYEPDTPWQHEFEASFIYTETPDQLRAIEEVKNDMRSDKPMDRLVCGDVGYGKTEVAIRAAFKAIQDRKQVALLCPTTILAQQHFNTFRERFADYPIRVEMISRFRTAKETKDIFAEARAGKIDMIVGTHALLSKSAQFRDLGLVIVDEEQRFGVQQKERLKELRTSVDFLTLTATPIPRTLYMALSGLRDMSLINTPPADRHPIKTRVIHFDAEQIEEAILRELNRGGQVFFVHNRVHSIHQVADRVKEIVPSARIAVAHGQMPDQELEDVMLHFVDGKIDILVSTTIIENGVDIPNVNTIIVNRADAFGLAQLYQLRGRVGRENRRAYAYLIVPAGQAITEQAVARLAAIEEFTELGMGFNIAMRDMEIRGAGNLLGREQHGSMNDVGFELYCRMLEEAVEAMRGNVHEEEAREVEIQWKVSAHIPQSFVPVESQRVMLYKRVAEVRTLEELDEVADEMRDRYGEVRREAGGGDAFEALPEPVENLLAVARLRLRGRRLAIRKIALTQGGFKLYREDAVRELGPGARKVIKNGVPKIYTDDPGALEFHYANWNTRRQLHEAASVLAVL